MMPSLLSSFYLVNDCSLEDKILEVIFNQTNQTRILFSYLTNLEVLFEPKDILPYRVQQTFIFLIKSQAHNLFIFPFKII